MRLAWIPGIIMPNFILLEIKTIGLSTNPYTQLLQYLQFPDYTSTEVATYRVVSVMLNPPRFHASASISQSNFSQSVTPTRYIEKSYFSAFSSLRHSKVCFILKKLQQLHMPQTTLPVPGTSELTLVEKAQPSVLYVPKYGHGHSLAAAQGLPQRRPVSSTTTSLFLIIS